ncbi:MAG: HlyD family efflux transporter periplasmic adaptor subunit [Planctomycetes bacterium]|nr:HlyD family efflux transporter periplasmic adaptor subunit [Planctomycetota bacterium]
MDYDPFSAMDDHDHDAPFAPRQSRLDLVRRACLSLGIVLSAMVLVMWMVRTRPVAASKAPDTRPVPIAVMEVSPMPTMRGIRGFGTVRALESADVAARVDGVVVALGSGVREGMRVEKGAVLVELDGDDARRQLQAALQSLAALRAQTQGLDIEERALADSLRLADEELKLARGEVARVEAAFADGVALQRELDRAKSAVLAADRGLSMAREALEMVAPRRESLTAQGEAQSEAAERARLSVERSTIVAPISGILQSLPVEPGEIVAPGRMVARIVEPSRLEVPIALPASSRGALAVGQRAQMMDASGTIVEGLLTRLAPEDDPVARTLVAWAELPGGSGLVPGSFVEATVLAPDATPRTVVPRRSVRNDRLLLVEDGRVRWRPVRIAYAIRRSQPASGIDDVEWLALEEPLPHGTLVMLDAARRIAIGARVEPLRPGESAASVVEPKGPPGTVP